MNIVVQYFDGCPNWRVADERLKQALRATGQSDVVTTYVEVVSDEQAADLQFAGSPTVLVNGEDPFANQPSTGGLSCRLYSTPDGIAGSPTVEQLIAALVRAS